MQTDRETGRAAAAAAGAAAAAQWVSPAAEAPGVKGGGAVVGSAEAAAAGVGRSPFQAFQDLGQDLHISVASTSGLSRGQPCRVGSMIATEVGIQNEGLGGYLCASVHL